MVIGDDSWTYLLLRTVNRASRKAAIIPSQNPFIWSTPNEAAVSVIAGTMSIPYKTSIRFILYFVNSGSKSAVKKVTVDIVIKAIEALETLIAPKKKIQCKATKIPTQINLNTLRPDKTLSLLNTPGQKIIMIEVRPTLHHTSTEAGNVMRSPKIAVNPQRTTAI